MECNLFFITLRGCKKHYHSQKHKENAIFKNIEMKIYEWPPKLTFNNSINCLKQFYYNTDYKLIKRYVCSICRHGDLFF